MKLDKVLFSISLVIVLLSSLGILLSFFIPMENLSLYSTIALMIFSGLCLGYYLKNKMNFMGNK